MEVIVKDTGQHIEVIKTDNQYVRTDTNLYITYNEDELEFDTVPDYWERLYHEYAGIAMQKLIEINKQKNKNSIIPGGDVLLYNAKICAKEACMYAKELLLQIKNN